MNRLFNISRISRRMVIFIVCCSTLLTVITTGVQLYFDYRRDLQSISQEIDQIQSVHLQLLVNSLWVLDSAQIQAQLDGIERLSYIEYVAVSDGSTIRWSSGNLQSQRIITAEFPLIFQYGNKVTDRRNL